MIDPASSASPGQQPASGFAAAGAVRAEAAKTGCTGIVIPVHSLTCETFRFSEDDDENHQNGRVVADIGALAVDTLAVTAEVPAHVIDRLRELSGRRLMIGPGNVLEADRVRIGNIPGTYDPNLWIQPLSDNELAPNRIKIEGSVHRHILGHNIKGGPTSILLCAKYLINQASQWLGSTLPSWENWKLTRVDLTELYDCGSEDGAYEAWNGLAEGLRKSSSLRTLPRNYGTTIYAGLGFKAYLKAPEVKKHKPSWCDTQDHVQLIHEASNLVRLETTYRQREISRLSPVCLESLDELELKFAARRRIAKYTRLGEQGMETVRTIEQVTRRLESLYPPQTAASLIGTWLRLTTLGESVTRDQYKKPTYYRHLKQLRDASVSWQGTDVMRIELVTALPAGFCFSPTSPWAVRGEDPKVTAALAA